MRSLDAFIHHENLILFKKQLADPRIDDTTRQQLLRLLAEERTKDPLPEKRTPRRVSVDDSLRHQTL